MDKIKKGVCRIGTSGIVLPGTKQSFPLAFQQKTRLHYYSSLFNTIEINSTFYKVPMGSTVEKWSSEVDNDFRFTIKLWKEITHAKELKINPQHIDQFMEVADRAGPKKGCVLIQFPGKITLEYYNQVEEIMERLKENDPMNTWSKAVEFRSDSWYVTEAHELLSANEASLVLHDTPKGKNTTINKSAQSVYLRFHGPTGDYRGSYTDGQLRKHSVEIKDWLGQGKNVYAYFNNTMGNAFENAITLKRLIRTTS